MQTKNIIYGIIIGLITTLGVALVGGAILASTTVTSTGTVIKPATLTSIPDTFTWGNLVQGTTTQTILKVNNTGSVATGPLQVTNNLAVTGLSLTHNMTSGATVLAGGTLTILFNLTASTGATLGAFNIAITIAEVP